VTFVEVALDVGHPVKRSAGGFHQCDDIVGLVRDIPARHGVADDAGVVAAEKAVERGAEAVRAERELVNAEVEPAANLVDDLVADDGAHD
jgi:hypothetical protein